MISNLPSFKCVKCSPVSCSWQAAGDKLDFGKALKF